MKRFVHSGIALAALALPAMAQRPAPQYGPQVGNLRAETARIFELANAARARAGVGRLDWDPALADAALRHCQWMVADRSISHRYPGEPELSERTAQAGAHFSVIEENVAIGPSADSIHEQWMESPGHRANLLSPEVNRVGIAVLAGPGGLYSVADYSRAVEALSPAQVEARVAAMVSPSGVSILRDASVARVACTADNGMPRPAGGPMPRFVMRWQDSDLAQLPQELAERLATGRYHAAAVGSCPARVTEGAFTAYRVAVLLY